jgi:CBS domain-containing protein
MDARSLMTPEPLTVSMDTLLSAAMRTMEEHGVRHLPVVSPEQRLLGLVSDRELMKATGWLGPSVLAELEPTNRSVKDVLQSMPLTVCPDTELRDVAERLAHWGIGCTPVVGDDRLVGMITETDVMREFVEARRQGTLPSGQDPALSECMTRAPKTIDPSTPVGNLADLFDSEDYRHLPVTDGDHLVGIVSDRDVRMVAGRGLAEDTPVSELIAGELFSLRPRATLSDAAGLMIDHKISAVPVAELGLLEGIVTSTDVLVHCAHVL